MSSAQLYVSTDVVERLTRPIYNNNTTSSGSNSNDNSIIQYYDNNNTTTSDRPIMDMESFMGSLNNNGNNNNNNQKSFSTPGKPKNNTTKTGISSDTKMKRNAKFESFLARQQAILKKKAETTKLVRL